MTAYGAGHRLKAFMSWCNDENAMLNSCETGVMQLDSASEIFGFEAVVDRENR